MLFERKWKTLWKVWITAGLLAGVPLLAQQPSQQVRGVPDCQIFFTLTSSSTASVNLDNRTNGCTVWTATYNNFASGFSALTFTVQSAAQDAAGTGPGTWGTFSGTVVTGTNPIATTTQAYIQLTGYNPWVRVLISGLTGSGTVSGTIYGWKSNPADAGGGGGGTQDVNVVQWGSVATTLGQKAMAASVPVTVASDQSAVKSQLQINNGAGNNNLSPASTTGQGNAGDTIPSSAPWYWNGTTWDAGFYCTNRATITLSAGTDAVIVTGTAAKKTHICHLSLASDTGASFTIQEGTGSTCGTGTTAMTGAYANATALAFDFTSLAPLSTATNADDVCVHASTSVTAGGVVIYAVY